MKAILYIIVCILLLSVVYANDNKFYVEEVKVYVGESRQRDADVDGGSFDAERGDKIKFRVELKNNYTRRMEDIDFYLVAMGVHKNGDDIEKTEEKVDINDGATKTLNLEFDVPGDAIYDYYDIEIEIEGELENGTEIEDWIQIWEMEVLEPEDGEETTEEKSILEHTLNNCTIAMGRIPDYITCEYDKNKMDTDKQVAITERDNKQQMLDECQKSLDGYRNDDWENKFNNCTSEKSGMVTRGSCNAEIRTIEDKLKEENKPNYTIPIGIAVAGLIWYFNKKKQPLAEVEV